MSDTTAPHGTLPVLAFSAPILNDFGIGGIGGIGANATPSFGDIDGDGDLDAFLGERYGRTWVYLNVGSTTSPDFESAGQSPYGPTNVSLMANASLADIDADGDLDLFLGDIDGNIEFYANTGGAGSPIFAAHVTNPFGLTDVGERVSPAFADIDGDGDLDAFVGERFGDTRVFLNTGSAGSPAFAAPVTNPYGLTSVGQNARPSLGDIDGDGDLDAFIGNFHGDTVVYLNTGSATNPVFAAPLTNPYGLARVGHTFTAGYYASPSFADIDGDGDPDVFFGELSGVTLFSRNNSSFAAPVTSNVAAGTYGIGSVITLNVAFSENLIVNSAGGTPTLALETGTNDRLATYAGGSGTATLRFSYTVQAGDSSVDLDITGTSALALNGATIQDAAGNDAILTLDAPGAAGSLAADSAFVIDGIAPTATLATAALTSSGSATVRSTEAGTAYLVNTSVVVTSVASITSAAGANWNSVAINADTDTALAVTGLRDGTYTLYATDVAGNLSAASAGVVIVDGHHPHGTLIAPEFSAPLTNPYGLTDVGDFASPSFADIDGDGDLDAFVGKFDGNTLVFLNTGTAANPAFAAPVTNPYGLTDVGFSADPVFADIDGDGDLDAFIGNVNGNTLSLLNIGSATSPVFAAPVNNPYGMTNVGGLARPSFADIDGDGDLDALIGNGFGNTLVSLNTGSPTSPAFAAPVANPYGLPNAGPSASPSFADIDGDGDLDAFIGNQDGNSLLSLNTGSATSPSFAAPVTNPFGLTDVGYFASPSFADIDGDGDLDALIGERFGNTLVFLNSGFVAPVTSSTANDTYGVGNVITLNVAFSENVMVDTSSGVPTLGLETGAADRLATYTGGSGTSTLSFRYTVQAGDTSADLDFTSVSALALNGGTIRDPAGNDAILTLAAPRATGSLAANAALLIDGIAPTSMLTSATIPNTGSVSVQSTESGIAYLVRTSVGVTDVASISGAFDASWNAVAITAANTDTTLAATGLVDGSYTLYTTDLAGNLSSASSAVITIDNPPRGTMAGTPVFSTPLTNPYGLTDADYAAGPSLADIDGDGDLDAFIGNYNGITRVYLNAGSAASPGFAAPLLNPYGLTNSLFGLVPHFADIDGDGDLDAFIGTYYGDTLVALNTGSASSPAFAAPVGNPYGLADVGRYARSQLADIDGDGDLDAFVGNYNGDTLVFLNTGSASSPAFTAPAANPYGLTNVGRFANPDLADIDRDGDLDAVIGNLDGTSLLFLNTGSAASPAFAAPVANPYGLTGVGFLASPSFADIDGDGDLDALIGEGYGNTIFFLNTGSFIAPVTSSTANGSYGVGSVITLNVAFSENVLVDTSGGVPTLSLETGATDRLATYAGGSGTSTLTFSYTVQAGDTSADLDVTSATALALNGGTIRDAAGNNAILMLAEPGAPGSLAGNAALVIDAGNHLPSGSVAVTGTLAQGQMLKASNTLADADGLGVIVYQWQAAGVDIAGANAASFTLTQAEVGKPITVVASYTDTFGTKESVSSAATTKIANINDAPTGTVTLTNGRTQGQTLTASNTLADLDGMGTVSYQWQQGGVNIPGATGPSFTLTQAQVGLTVNVVASYTDGGGTKETVASAPTKAVLNANLPHTGTIGITGLTVSGQTLGITSTLADPDGLASVSYQWLANGKAIPGATKASYSLTDAEGGKVISVAAHLTDSEGNTEDIVSDATTAVITGALAGTTAADKLTGTASADALYGLAGADTLDGGTGGNDTMDGGAGIDRMVGHAGDDSYMVDDSADLIVEATGEGNDSVTASANYGLPGNVENLLLAVAALIGTGNNLANVITGNANANSLGGLSGNDTLQGGAGNDSLAGGAGNDSLDGGTGADAMTGSTGDDSYLVDDAGDATIELPNEGADVVFGSLSWTLADNLEALVLTGSSNLTGTGNAADNLITGNSGTNTLDGAAGNDTLDGGAGADRLLGRTGDDTYILVDTLDTPVEAISEGTDTIQTSVAYTLGANFENLVLGGNADVAGTGNSLSNAITGNSGANSLAGANGSDTLSGAAGNDTLDGGGGADRMLGGTGNDTYSQDNLHDSAVELAGEGIDTVISDVRLVLRANVENLVLTGTGNLKATGNDEANSITGNAGNNKMDGRDGNDSLSGGAGNDTLTGGVGADQFVFGNASGQDKVTDFVSADGDRIVLSAGINATTITSAAAALVATTDTAAGALITLGGGNTVLLTGVSAASLTAADFVVA